MNASRFALLFDHSVVRPDATRQCVEEAAATAARLRTASLSVQPRYIELGRKLLDGSGVLGTVVGFPHGNETPTTKEYQAREVLDRGAQEIDMVMNIPALKNGERDVKTSTAYLQAGARRFGSTRTDQFVRAFQQLSPAEEARFAPYL